MAPTATRDEREAEILLSHKADNCSSMYFSRAQWILSLSACRYTMY